MAEPIDVRAEFDTFFENAYPWLCSQVRAITGDAATAHWAVDEAFVRCWRSWASVRRTDDPLGWVRWTALRVAAGTRRELPFRRRTAEPTAVTEDSEEAVVLDALHRLPASQRRAIVLHYMGDVTVAELARRSGTTPAAVEWLLDTGFDALVGLLTWPDAEEDDASFDPRYDWTAEALGDTATRLAADVTVPAPGAVLQRAAVLRWARRAVPVAVSAACVSGVVVLAAQLNPGGGESAAPRTPYTYSVAGPEPSPATQPYDTAPVPGGPAVAAPEVPLGTSIVSVARSTPLADFGISAPPSPRSDGSPGEGAGGGSPSGLTGPAGTATAGGTGGSGGSGSTGGSGGTGGTAATPPTGGAGTGAPASPGTVPPGTVPPTTVPPTTVPPTTTPTTPPTTTTPLPTTAPPTTAPPTTRPPTTNPTTGTTTTTTEAPAATTTSTTTTATKTTTTQPAPADPTTAAKAAATTTTTTKPAPTTDVTAGS